MAAAWTTEENEGSCKRTTTNYESGANTLALCSMRGRNCCRTFFRYFALLMVAGWTTEETRALVSVPLPITKAGLTHSRFSSMRITTASMDAS